LEELCWGPAISGAAKIAAIRIPQTNFIIVISSPEIHLAAETAVSSLCNAAKYIGKLLPTQGIRAAAQIRGNRSHCTQELRQPGKIYTLCVSHFFVRSAHGRLYALEISECYEI
jgi:hypothetical protein